MQFIYVPLGLLLVIVAVAIDTYRKNIKIKKTIAEAWGRAPRKQRWDKPESVASYWNDKLARISTKGVIDHITWNDLDMDSVYERINATLSSVGSEYLYARLHQPIFDVQELEDFEHLVQVVSNNEGLREHLSICLHKLGKNDFNGVSEFIFSPKDKKLKHAYIYPVLASLPLLSLGFGFFSWQLTAIMLAGFATLNMVVYYKTKAQLEIQLNAVSYITSIVVCVGRLRKVKELEVSLSELYEPLKKITWFGSALARQKTDLEFILEYIKIIFMYDFLNYNRIISTICKHNAAFHQLWQEVGKLDAALSVASYRQSVSFYTTPQFTEAKEVRAEEIYHPLVKDPVANPLVLTRNTIITGSNASGKSTYVKAVAINSIFAQTIHTCLASSFSLKKCLVFTSMAVRDDVVAGDSYFIAEIKSLRRILDALNDDTSCLCFVDEILKGTNTIERIAASASILGWLATQNCLCMVASHDIELTEIMGEAYDNYHFREHITDEGVAFDYRVREGRTTTRNAIKLLEFMGYPEHIVVQANDLAGNFEKTRKWV